MAFDGIVLHNVIEHMNILETGRISKLWQISRHELLLQVRAHRQNYQVLMSIHPMYARIQITNLTFPRPEQPSALAMRLRKHLEGAVITGIEQVDLERIVKITLRARNEFRDDVTLTLYHEIMGKHSNIILADDSGKIIECLKRVSPSESTRIMQPGLMYSYPPLLDKKNPFTSDYENGADLVKTYQGFSRDLANEVSYRMERGADFGLLMQSLKNSEYLYINRQEKERYHLIPLTHLGGENEALPVFEGLDDFYNLIDEKDRIRQQTADLGRYIRREYEKNVTKLGKLEQTKFDSENADGYRINGDILFAHLDDVEKGASEVTLENYYDGEMITIPLDPRKDARENAKAYYAKYQKAKNARLVLDEQIQNCQEEIDYFDTLITLMDQADWYDAMEIKEELEDLGYLQKKRTKGVRARGKKEPHYTTFETKDGILIYVGKNNLQNDWLTWKKARRHDLWLHVKDMPGSHVILTTDTPDEYTMRLAAKIAAYYSKGRLSGSVPVNYAPVSTLKKPKAGKPGLVLLSHYKTIYIDPDDEFLKEVTKR